MALETTDLLNSKTQNKSCSLLGDCFLLWGIFFFFPFFVFSKREKLAAFPTPKRKDSSGTSHEGESSLVSELVLKYFLRLASLCGHLPSDSFRGVELPRVPSSWTIYHGSSWR